MNRNSIKIIAILLSLILLCGCAGPVTAYRQLRDDTKEKIVSLLSEEPEDPHAEERKIREERMLDFADMEYTRPDSQIFADLVAQLEEELEKGKLSLKAIMALLDGCYDEFHHFSTMTALANVRSCLDMTDEFYSEEYAFCSDQAPVMDDLMDELYYACAGSKYGARLEKEYFWDGFCEEYADIADSMYTPEMVELMQQEAALVSEYRDTIAAPTVSYKGKEMEWEAAQDEAVQEFYEAEERYLADANDANLLAAYIAVQNYYDVFFSYYEKYNPILSDIFIKMVKLRHAMAKESGYDSYVEMQYEFEYERDFTPEQADELLASVEKKLVPVYREMNEKIDVYNLALPETDKSVLESSLGSICGVMGEDFTQAYDFMMKYHLYDFEDLPYKTDMSFCTYFDEYEAPYIMVTPASLTDPLTAIHEFGHYVDFYVNFSFSDETLELAECFSMGLELLAMDMLDGICTEDEVKAMGCNKLMDVLLTFSGVGQQAAFERELYALDESELTAERLNEIWLDLSCRFGASDQPNPDDRVCMTWIDIPHFFEVPLYVISYAVSETAAVQLYSAQLENGNGAELYKQLLEYEEGTVLDNLERIGLKSPFEPDSAEMVESTMRRMYSKFAA